MAQELRVVGGGEQLERCAAPIEVRDGGLVSYGSDVGEDYERAALYVDRILKGARVVELPFQEPTHVGLTINLRTAQSIGLTVPASLQVRADEVTE